MFKGLFVGLKTSTFAHESAAKGQRKHKLPVVKRHHETDL